MSIDHSLDPESELLAALLRGEDTAFRDLIGRHHRALLHVARHHVSTNSVAEEVVQEAWLGVVKGLHRFEGRSSLRTWLTRIVGNIARTRGVAEARCVPFSSVEADDDRSGPAVDPERFLRSGRYAGHWADPPASLRGSPEGQAETTETMSAVYEAIRSLGSVQQRVIWLRDVEGWSADEVCRALSLTASNQRVLLHRARSRVRELLEPHLDESRNR